MRTILLVLLLFNSCGQKEKYQLVSTMEASPNPVIAQHGVCSSVITLVELSGHDVSLLVLDVLLEDSYGHQKHLSFTYQQLVSMMDSTMIPGKSIAHLSLSIDLQQQGLSFPATVNLIALGSYVLGTEHFVGKFDCQTGA